MIPSIVLMQVPADILHVVTRACYTVCDLRLKGCLGVLNSGCHKDEDMPVEVCSAVQLLIVHSYPSTVASTRMHGLCNSLKLPLKTNWDSNCENHAAASMGPKCRKRVHVGHCICMQH